MRKATLFLTLCFVVMSLTVFVTPIPVYAYTELSSDVFVTQDKETDETDEEHKSSDSMFPSNRNRLNERAIQAVDSGMAVNTETVAQPYNFADIMSRIALVFVLIAVAVFWIINMVKEKKDPLRKYLK